MHTLTALWMLVRGVAKGEGQRGARLRARLRQRLNRLKVVEPVVAIIVSSANALLNDAIKTGDGDSAGDAAAKLVPDAGQLIAGAFQERKMSSMSATSLSVQVLSASNLASIAAESGGTTSVADSERRSRRKSGDDRTIETYVVVQWRDEEMGRTQPAAPTAAEGASGHSRAS